MNYKRFVIEFVAAIALLGLISLGWDRAPSIVLIVGSVAFILLIAHMVFSGWRAFLSKSPSS